MGARDELEAAYFALLRAREELTALRRYEEYLRNERRRLVWFEEHGRELAQTVDRRQRRSLAHTAGPLHDAVADRLAVVDDELTRMPDRIEAAEAYVAECEQDHDALRRSA